MWWLSVVFLALLAGEIQMMRMVAEQAEQATPDELVLPSMHVYGLAMLALWPAFWLELLARILAGSQYWRYGVLYCLMPPLRLGGRDHATWTKVWLPKLAWQPVNRKLVREIEKAFSGPMVLIALAILPVLGVEWFYQEAVHQSAALHRTLETGKSIIWFAFAFELFVMVSLVRKKVRYCVEHWIDLLVVALPMFAFLRLLWLVQMGNVSRLLRVYRLRGIAIRGYRAILMLDVVRRLLHINPERRLRALRERIEEYHHLIEETRAEMRELEARIAEQESTAGELLTRAVVVEAGVDGMNSADSPLDGDVKIGSSRG